MLIDFIENNITETFAFEPTSRQKELIRILAGFLNSEAEVLIIKGYAGTGKTSLLAAYTKVLRNMNAHIELLAPTGRAAKVFAGYAKAPASTIHKTIYRQASVSDNLRFTLQFNARSNTLFIIDEASMLANNSAEKSMFGSGLLLHDVFDYVFGRANGCKLIIVGDDAQLPPVGLSESPALSKEYVEKAFLKNTQFFELSEVVRQEQTSGILGLATHIRTLIKSEKTSFPRITPHYDVEPITGEYLLDALESSYDTAGIENTIVITRSNKLANRYNQGIRSAILWREQRIAKGDYIMIVKNNYFWSQKSKHMDFIANGDVAEVVFVSSHEDMYDFSFVNVCLRFPDYNNEELSVKLLLNTLDSESPSLSYEESQRLYTNVLEDYLHIGNKRNRYKELQKNEFFNALQIKFSYAVTCHKSQGGQWEHVFIDHGYIAENSIDIDFLRWLYTACTRATKKIYPINFKKDFFDSDYV